MTTTPAPSRRLVVYLAGPEVFLPNALDIGAEKKRICARFGYDAIFPLDGSEPLADDPLQAGLQIFDQCVVLMDRCDLIVANMTPFRGSSMDVGTAVEVGYMFSRGRPVHGYTNVTSDYAARVQHDGFAIEAFGFSDNLMCEGSVRRSGNSVVRTAVPPDRLLTDLRGFEHCVQLAAARAQG